MMHLLLVETFFHFQNLDSFLAGQVRERFMGGHFNKFHESILQCRVKTESELKLNVNSTKWKINIFSSIFVKSRPIETRRSERV